METGRKTWRKSSYSSTNGGDCVECAPLGIVEWRKSSFSSTNGGECVEVAASAPCIAIRDSKNPGGAVLTVSRRRFEDFINSLSV
ncbi:DUF397 domain-containing protein [Streptomyces sp. W16]|uniref:DUF397 domain-containing protein n=1 Tax=Streptomyces sp. W16 TaxID=3076631 RepID=UPI00295ACFB8|nr:DUF397 domain-containing protein [Streptomyces sp. W16]MDV9173557.1 DUF397 domain-containing protein [Streptomyces sp. W16]